MSNDRENNRNNQGQKSFENKDAKRDQKQQQPGRGTDFDQVSKENKDRK